MTVLRNPVVGALFLILVVAAVGVFTGCSSEKSEDTQATTEEAAAEMTEAAEETAAEAAVDLASFDNPKEGICPVCAMKVEKGYIEVATITDKKYACCSAGCVATLAKNPDKYLAGAEEGHEGHNH